MPVRPEPWSVVDLFSGAGGMSYGFHAHPAFAVVGAADAQIGKPSSGRGTLGCNETYFANIGVSPIAADLWTVCSAALFSSMGLARPRVPVLCAHTPSPGVSR